RDFHVTGVQTCALPILAHLSGDEGLIEAFRTGEDLHSFVASRAFSVPIEEVTPELRRRVKAMSYGLAYGLSAYGLAQQLKISTEIGRAACRGSVATAVG